jgi:actin-related protein
MTQMEWETNKNFRVILDNGSHQIRAGMASSNAPQLVFHNLTGEFHPNHLNH